MLSKIKNYIADNTGILIRIDDVAENMNWNLMEKTELLFQRYDIKPVLGVIPNNKDTEFLSINFSKLLKSSCFQVFRCSWVD